MDQHCSTWEKQEIRWDLLKVIEEIAERAEDAPD